MAKVKIKRTLISVSDKRGLVEFAKGLKKLGVEIISTGGTAQVLKKEKIPVIGISEVTGFPEMLDGRVKTLHPMIHGGLLARRDKKDHMEQLKRHKITPIDLVVVNLYPFAATVAKKGVTIEEAIENIDIGGPSMIRSAAKNADAVAVVVNPDRYKSILSEMERNKGALTDETRRELQKEAFRHTSAYDSTIYAYLAQDYTDFPDALNLSFKKLQTLRYGENPHQRAAYYGEFNPPPHALVFAQKLHGKELSFNNILDMDAAWRLCAEFAIPAVVIIKHNNPCGVALAKTISEAFKKAWAADPVSAFGSVIAINRPVDELVAQEVKKYFVELIIAPAFLEESLEILTQKKDIRLMVMGEERMPHLGEKDLKKVEGGLLVQDMDLEREERDEMKVVTKKHPTEPQWEDLLFAWRVAKHVKSNAIVLAKDLVTLGVGAGQMNRVNSSKIAAEQAGKKAKGAAMASDAFFPFRDGIDAAAKVGVTAVIQPGGSLRDGEVIAAANEHKMAMVFTGKRHFKH